LICHEYSVNVPEAAPKKNSGFYKAATDFTDYTDFMDDSIPEKQKFVKSVAAFVFFSCAWVRHRA